MELPKYGLLTWQVAIAHLQAAAAAASQASHAAASIDSASGAAGVRQTVADFQARVMAELTRLTNLNAKVASNEQ
jgi:hypothetical protein